MHPFGTKIKVAAALAAMTGGLVAAFVAPAQAATAAPCARTIPNVIFAPGTGTVVDGAELREIRGLELTRSGATRCVYRGVGLYFDVRFNMVTNYRDETHSTRRH